MNMNSYFLENWGFLFFVVVGGGVLFLFLQDKTSLNSLGCSGTLFVDHAVSNSKIPLSLPPKCWGQRCVPPRMLS